jgi:hypothetical protein
MFPKFCFVSFLFFSGFASAQDVPRSSHVWMITEENHSYENIVGNSEMPYYNQLIDQYGLATQLYANQHSSLPALMWLVAGAPVEPNNSTVSCNHDNDNIVRELLKNGYTWRSYQQNMPYPGFRGLFGGPHNSYYRRHNPLIDFSDVCPGTGQDQNSVPYSQMADDFAQGQTVNYAYITPDATKDGHSGSLQVADRWLRANVPAILSRPEFQSGGDGILFIAWDEGNLGSDGRCSANIKRGCGGRTATLVIGPQVKPGYKSTITYHNENILKTVCAAMGLSTCPGAAQDAAPMADFFGSSGGPSHHGLQIISPAPNETISGSTLHIVAHAGESVAVSQVQAWDNGVKLGWYAGADVNQYLDVTPGSHVLTILDLDSNFNIIHQSSVSYFAQ